MFADEPDAQEAAGLSSLPSPRQDYINLAAVPQFHRPSMELKVPTATSGHIWSDSVLCSLGGCGVLGFKGGGQITARSVMLNQLSGAGLWSNDSSRSFLHSLVSLVLSAPL